MKITSYNHHVRRLLSFREALVLKPRLPDSIEPSLLSNQSFRAFRETAGTFSKPRRGGCPHPRGWGLFSRSRRESAFTHLSFRGAPRLEPAFIYLSFRIRFSGEESAFCRAAPSFSRFLRKGGDLLKPRRRRCPHLPNTLPLSVVILRKRSPSPREGLPTSAVPAAERDDINAR